jgi:ribose 5-phosphate isomerase B
MPETIIVDGISVPVGSHQGKKIVIGSDHRGFAYKAEIVKALKEKSYDIIDIGTYSSERCDYPAISDKIAREIGKDPLTRVGIGICGSGIGILIPASKHRCIYIARCLTPKEAETSRMHNNSNFLGIGADYSDLKTALQTVDAWLTTQFYSDPNAEEQYLRRFVQTVKLENALIK